MKLEAVDKRSPGLIRVATVEEVDTHRIKVTLRVCVSEVTEDRGVCVWVCVCGGGFLFKMLVKVLWVPDSPNERPSAK